MATMKVKTRDLDGRALDWAVAKCEGLNPRFFTEEEAYRAHVMTQQLKYGDYVVVLRPNSRLTPLSKYAGYNDGVCWKDNFEPSANWSQGGPIIERERVKIDPRKGQWEATIWNEPCTQNASYGPTLLIAAMRCYVTSKLGDTVDIPKELA